MIILQSFEKNELNMKMKNQLALHTKLKSLSPKNCFPKKTCIYNEILMYLTWCVKMQFFKVIVPTILAFFKESFKVAKLKDDIKHRLNPISSIKTLVKHHLRVICIMGGLTIVFLSTRQKFESEIN